MNIGFTGCSFTYGKGLAVHQLNYSAIIGKETNNEVHNYAIPGASNLDVFTQTLYFLLEKKHDVFFVQWTSPGRQKFIHSLHHYPNTVFGGWNYPGDKVLSSRFTTNQMIPSIISKEKAQIFFDCYKILDNDINQYHRINTFTQILLPLSELIGTKIFFINGLLHIDKVFFQDQPIDFENLSKLTQELLGVHDLNNTDALLENLEFVRNSLKFIIKQKKYWINGDQSLQNMMVDTAADRKHPGILSHKKYADMILANPGVKKILGLQ